MHPLRALILGALAYGAFLVATAPATLLAGPVARASGGQVQLTGATGTLWQGRARLALTAAGGTCGVTLKSLVWG